MTANFTLFAIDDDWLKDNTDATFETVSDEAMFDSIDLEQASLEMVFEERSDALRYLAGGEFGPPGGLKEWDGADCYMGFISAPQTKEIAKLLSIVSADDILQAASWIDDDFRGDISDALENFYPELKQFVAAAAAKGHGLACLFVE